MKLCKDALKCRVDWEKAGISLPEFDLEQIRENTWTRPTWIHFGAGNIFRAFIARAYQQVLEMEFADTGIIAVDSFDYEVIDRIFKPYDDLTLLVQMQSDGVFRKSVVASIVESLTTDSERAADQARLEAVFTNPSLQMVSFTITEKGYAVKSPQGSYLGVVLQDIENGPKKAMHTMSQIAALLYKRFQNGAHPVTLVSMDNCSHNGDKLKEAILTISQEWMQKGYVTQEFIEYLSDKSKVAYPLSMIDKITPRPSEVVQKALEDAGIEGMAPIITSKNSYMAPFVNAEISEYLVIEDSFANGRPALEKAGVLFTDRETVNRVETMKVTTCLNPLHTALAVSGCLLGYTLIANEMKDPLLKRWIEKIGYEEGLKVVVNPGIIDPKQFIDEVVNERLTNPFIPDTPQRIATDTSQKVGIRFGETIKAYMKRDELKAEELTAIPLAIAAWVRYLLGVDDEGKAFDLSADPLLDTLKATIKDIELGSKDVDIRPILNNQGVFGVDLYEAGLGIKIEKMFAQMIEGPGAVRRTLERYV